MDDRPTRFAPADGRVAPASPPRHRVFTVRRIGFIVLGLLMLAALAWVLTPGRTMTTGRGRFAGGGPMPISDAAVKTGDMPVTLNALGTVTPLATVTVKTQINGQLTQIAFEEGQQVKAGDFLVQVDPRPYQVALEQAEGTLARDQALLANAKVDLVRYQKLVAEDSIAEQQLATQKALVLQDEGTVKTDQAQVDSAKLNLVYCHITAPVSGRVGLRQVDLGNYVTPGDANGLVVITQLQPITVVFTLPEDNVPAVLKQLHAGATMTVAAFDRSHTTKLATGTLTTVDNQIDTTTGTVKLKATFPNTDEALFPNQFVNVDLLLDTLHQVTLIPQAAVQRGAPGTFVYVVKPEDSTVSVRPVTVGVGDANNIVAQKGVQAGEMVVTDGADKLKDGAKVIVPAGKDAAPAGDPQQPAQRQHHRRSDSGGSGDQHGPPAQQPQPN